MYFFLFLANEKWIIYDLTRVLNPPRSKSGTISTESDWDDTKAVISQLVFHTQSPISDEMGVTFYSNGLL